MKTYKEYIAEEKANTITMDVPLFLRMMEYAREDAKDDLDLHFVLENIIRIQKSGVALAMKDYKDITKIG